MTEPKKRGGRREGAGRPHIHEERMHNLSTRFTARQHETFTRLGGPKWLRALLDAEANLYEQSNA